MSVSNSIINFINKRRDKIQKNYPGSLGNFFKDGGNNFIYSKLKLNSDSFVIDGGGYQGEFIDNILINFGCKIDSYEPLKKEYENLKKKYFYNDRVKVFNLAIFSDSKELYLNKEGISSYIVNDNIGKDIVKIKAEDITKIINKKTKVDLLKLNVEGAEYEILNRVIETNNLNKFGSFLIQYHRSVENSNELRKKIRQKLVKENYQEVFNYDFVWEYWIK